MGRGVEILIDKETQIKILLYGNPLGFACETLGVKDMRNHKYSKVFTVSKEEVYEYTSIHGIPQSDSTSRYSLVEGFHYFEEDGKWHTFFRREVTSSMKTTLMIMSLVKST